MKIRLKGILPFTLVLMISTLLGQLGVSAEEEKEDYNINITAESSFETGEAVTVGDGGISNAGYEDNTASIYDDSGSQLYSEELNQEQSSGTTLYTVSGYLNQSKPTIEQIKARYKTTTAISPTRVYSSQPSVTYPYSTGMLDGTFLQKGLTYLNYIRYVAGLNDVSLSSDYCESAQYGAVVLAANNVLTHTPSQPSRMSSSFYSKGYAATQSSNISSRGQNSNFSDSQKYDMLVSSLTGCMDDNNSATNLSRLGHRRWLLNPSLGKVGFGMAENNKVKSGGFDNIYIATKVADNSHSVSDYNFISWPSSGNFPNNLLGVDVPWSISLNPNKFSTANLNRAVVTVTRLSDRKSWTITSADNFTATKSTDMAKSYFKVETSSYGLNNCIIFNIGYNNLGADSYLGNYEVKVTGLTDKNGKSVMLDYTVNFFNIPTVAPTGIDISKKTTTLQVGYSETLTAAVKPVNATNNNIIWASQNSNVAEVDGNGKITGVSAGTTYIFAMSEENSQIQTYCKVTVSNSPSGTSGTTGTAGTTRTADVMGTTGTDTGVSVLYRTHVQSYGWQGYVTNGTMSGTIGLSKRLEAISVYVSGDSNLGIQYTTHVQSYGWQPWSSNGEMSGTEGESKRLEAIKLQLTGADKDKYDIYYRVHAQSYGWLGWAKNGAAAGTSGYSKRLEAIQIVIVKKGESFNTQMGGLSSARSEAYVSKTDSSTDVGGKNTPNVAYRTHIQTYGWQGWRYNGQMSGTIGQSKRLEGIEIKLTNCPYSGGITYRTHIQKYGWSKGWSSNGVLSGTSGESKRLEAIQIMLTGEMAEQYDVYYRVHAQSYGWLGWAKNGAPSGTAGKGKRLEGIQIVLVPKGGSAPANNYGGVISANASAYIQ